MIKAIITERVSTDSDLILILQFWLIVTQKISGFHSTYIFLIYSETWNNVDNDVIWIKML